MEAQQNENTGEISQVAQCQAYSAVHTVSGLLLLSCQIGGVPCMGRAGCRKHRGEEGGCGKHWRCNKAPQTTEMSGCLPSEP